MNRQQHALLFISDGGAIMTRPVVLSQKEREAMLIVSMILMMDGNSDDELVETLGTDFSPGAAINILNMAKNRIEGKAWMADM